MELTNTSIDELLVAEGILNIENLKKAWEVQKRTNEEMEDVLQQLGYVAKADILKAKSKKMGMEYVDLTDFEIKDDEILSGISEDILKKHVMLPVKRDEHTMTVAMKDPENVFAADDLRLFTALEIKPAFADDSLIERIIDEYFEGKRELERKKEELKHESKHESKHKAKHESKNNTDSYNDKKLSDTNDDILKDLKKSGANYFSISKDRLGGLLVKKGAITIEQLEKILEIQNEKKGRLGEIAIREGFVEKEAIYKVLEEQLHTKYMDVSQLQVEKDVIELVNEKIARKNKLIPVEKEGISLKVVMSDPTNIFTIDDLRLTTGLDIVPLLGDEGDIIEALDRHYEKQKINKNVVHTQRDEDQDPKTEGIKTAVLDFEEELKRVNEEIAVEIKEDGAEENIDISDIQNAPVVKMVNLILGKAVTSRASDIHIESFDDAVVVRNRVDGQLVELMRLEKKVHAAIVARIKIMSGLNIAERRLPQDGRISMVIDGRGYDMRVSILPTMFGEKVVIRLADKEGFNVNKQDLGFFDDDLAKFDEIMAHPHGIVLVTGPTGSGKSTTLYTALKELSTPNINILTVEDPVECTIKGINQVQVNTKAGLTFAAALRSFLRQDPDIIMVGEIRDGETADIAIRAAITGHLVLSTLHTNDAPSSITRMIDMGIEPFMISSSVVGVIAQRLVRKLCPKCREAFKPEKSQAELLGLEENTEIEIFRPKGCEDCNETGYKGRTAIYEIMTLNNEIMELISKNVPSNILKEAAIRNGMRTLRDNCIRLVKSGVTSIDEMLRVTFVKI